MTDKVDRVVRAARRLARDTNAPVLVACFDGSQVVVSTQPDVPGVAELMMDVLQKSFAKGVTHACECGDPKCPIAGAHA